MRLIDRQLSQQQDERFVLLLFFLLLVEEEGVGQHVVIVEPIFPEVFKSNEFSKNEGDERQDGGNHRKKTGTGSDSDNDDDVGKGDDDNNRDQKFPCDSDQRAVNVRFLANAVEGIPPHWL